jgi:hypothetical protein
MDVVFHQDSWNRLLVTLPPSQESIPVEPVRCFPLTYPAEHIALLDAAGREVLRIRSLADLDADQRRILEQELAEREFSPVIQRIVRTGPSLPCRWDVETDRGPTQFEIDSEDDIRRLPNGTVILSDANGIRFRIPHVESLDHHSRRLLRRFL